MAKKKKLAKLLDAVSDLLRDDPPKAKKLKKTRALERFIGKLEKRRRELQAQVSEARKHGKTAKRRAAQVERLEKQIKKARKILAEMN